MTWKPLAAKLDLWLPVTSWHRLKHGGGSNQHRGAIALVLCWVRL
jgi:hypothetical protein